MQSLFAAIESAIRLSNHASSVLAPARISRHDDETISPHPPLMTIVTTLTVIDDVACTVCACLCDDLRITVAENRIIHADGACYLAEKWFADQNAHTPPPAQIKGAAAAPETAIALAAAYLREAKAPLIYGLSRSSTDGQRAAVALADHLGAIIDTTASQGHAASILAVQQCGESTCSLGEVAYRADLVIFWGVNPVKSHPRHLERYSRDPHNERLLPGGAKDRTIVVIDPKATETATLPGVQHIPIRPGTDFEALWTLRALLKGIEPNVTVETGIPLSEWKSLAERMKSCRCGAIFFGYGVARQPLGNRVVEAMLELTIDLNAFTRFHARRMRNVGDVSGADNVLCWQTGFPFSVNLNRGYPRYSPGEYSANETLARGEADVALLIGADRIRDFDRAALDHLEQIQTILLDNPLATPVWSPTVRFQTAVYGIHHLGTAYRMDDIPIPLRPSLTTDFPTDGEVLRAIHALL